MRAISLLMLLILLAVQLPFAQQRETFDVITYVAPEGWTKTQTHNAISFAIADNTKVTNCQIMIYSTTNSKGSLAADFTNEWNVLVVKPSKPKTNPTLKPVASQNGWDMLSAGAPLTRKHGRSVAQLLTMSGYGRCMSIVMITNAVDCQGSVEEFLNSIAPQPLNAEDQSGSFRFPTTGG